MKFYREDHNWFNYIYNKIKNNKLTAVYYYFSPFHNLKLYRIEFFKDGKHHNNKNAAFIKFDTYKGFWLNDKCYGFSTNFSTKHSWRKFVRELKLKVFI